MKGVPYTYRLKNNVQQTDINEIYEHCIPVDIPYLISPWW